MCAGAHAKMTFILPCALEKCTEAFKERFKETVAAVVQAESDKVPMDFVSDSVPEFQVPIRSVSCLIAQVIPQAC